MGDQMPYSLGTRRINLLVLLWLGQNSRLSVSGKRTISVALCVLLFFAGETHLAAQTPGTAYCGPYTESSPIQFDDVQDMIIDGLAITNPGGNCITFSSAVNITIINCRLGPALGNGIELYDCQNVTIMDCQMESVSTGVYADHCEGLDVTHIEVLNVQGPGPRGQMVQFNTVTGPGNRVSYNVSENILGQSNPEDIISMFASSGTASDPIQISGNWIRGGGPSDSGGGIMTGDAGGAFIIVQNNVLVDPGQYGIAISGGADISILDNWVYARQQSFTNVGIYVWDQYDSDCGNHTVSGNQVQWVNSEGEINAGWDAGNCGTVEGWDDNNWNAGIGSSILPGQIRNCMAPSTVESIGFSDSRVVVYPNPSSSQLIVEFVDKTMVPSILVFHLYDLAGRKIKRTALGSDHPVFRFGPLPSGMYLYKIETNGRIVARGKVIRY